MRICLDRPVGDLWVCEDEDRRVIELSRHELPSGVKAGDWLRLEDGAYVLDEAFTRETRERIRKKMEDLWN